MYHAVKLHHQSGIAIGPILFIVALLAILAAAIAAGSGAFSGNTSNESASTQAATIIQVGGQLKDAVQRLLLENICSALQITFDNPIVNSSVNNGYTNASAPANKSCNVFDPNGGGVQFPTLTASTDEPATNDSGYFVINGNSRVIGLTCNNSGGQCNSIIGFLAIDSQAVCSAINKQLGLSAYSGLGYYTSGNDPYGHWNGTYHNGYTVVDSGTWPSPNPLMGCLTEGNGGVAGAHTTVWMAPVNAKYFFYVVMLAH